MQTQVDSGQRLPCPRMLLADPYFWQNPTKCNSSKQEINEKKEYQKAKSQFNLIMGKHIAPNTKDDVIFIEVKRLNI